LGGFGGFAPPTFIPPANPTANDQAGKRNFLAQPGSSANDDYLAARVTAPISPYEVKAGTVIPATMIGGINSDLPGTIIAQVRETVYDTATGQIPLIPQGARLVGVYHSGVTYGQTRVLVAWNRIIYPNGNSFDLGTMPGVDEGGYAGFEDQVNNHYLKIFGTALLASVFSASAQLSQPQSSSSANYNSTQILSAAVGQQANQVGAQLISRGLDIQPTIEIRNGYLFNVMVTKDMVLTPWQGMAALPLWSR
jgi:type IV secretion system protein VirB10